MRRPLAVYLLTCPPVLAHSAANNAQKSALETKERFECNRRRSPAYKCIKITSVEIQFDGRKKTRTNRRGRARQSPCFANHTSYQTTNAGIKTATVVVNVLDEHKNRC